MRVSGSCFRDWEGGPCIELLLITPGRVSEPESAHAVEASIPASRVPSAELVGAISIQNGALLLILRVYQVRSLGKKGMWLERALIVFRSQAQWLSGNVWGRRTARQGGAGVSAFW